MSDFIIENGVLKKYCGTEAHVVIPEAIDGLPVTRIGNSAFNDLERLESVVLPSTLTEIGQFAFASARWCPPRWRTHPARHP